MAYEQRVPRDYLAGTLSTAAALTDTALTSDAFATLPTDYSTGKYLPIVLHDPSAGLYEVAWVTGHAASSSSVTVVRGREGSVARAWPTGTHLVCAPTARDVVSAVTRATLPTDAHYGERHLLTDENVIVERSLIGWRASVGVGNPSEIGGGNGISPPAASVIQLRTGQYSGTTDGSGNDTVPYRVPFPNNTIAVVVTSRYEDAQGPYVVYSKTASSFSMTVWRFGTTSRLVNSAYTLDYVAVGY